MKTEPGGMFGGGRTCVSWMASSVVFLRFAEPGRFPPPTSPSLSLPPALSLGPLFCSKVLGVIFGRPFSPLSLAISSFSCWISSSCSANRSSCNDSCSDWSLRRSRSCLTSGIVLAPLSSQSTTSPHAVDTRALASRFTSARIHDRNFLDQLFLLQLDDHYPDLLRTCPSDC